MANWDIYDEFELKKPFDLHGLYKIIQRCKGYNIVVYIAYVIFKLSLSTVFFLCLFHSIIFWVDAMPV